MGLWPSRAGSKPGRLLAVLQLGGPLGLFCCDTTPTLGNEQGRPLRAIPRVRTLDRGVKAEALAGLTKRSHARVPVSLVEAHYKQPTKAALARRMKTSRAQLDRLLDPENQSVTLKTLPRAAEILGMRVQIELLDS
jgi:antitoxin HicB